MNFDNITYFLEKNAISPNIQFDYFPLEIIEVSLPYTPRFSYHLAA
jgi:hypothetical protein